MKIGYVRVSTVEQNEIRQEVLMKELGVERIYIDKASGRNMKRPQLEEMMNFMREGDVIVVESISRLSRSIRDFLYLLDKFQQEGVRLVSQKEQLDTDTPQGRFMLNIFASLGEFEADQNKQRQREGIELAKAAGKYKGRKPIQIDEQLFRSVYKDVREGKCTNTYAMKVLGLKSSTYYRTVKRLFNG